MISQEMLKNKLRYDPDLGVFVRESGKIAGYVSDERGYVRITINGHCYRAHRLAFLYMTGSIPEIIDHINGNTSDNRWCNLRAATRTLNNYNTRLQKSNISGVKGVQWKTNKNRWVARLNVNGSEKWVGTFKTKEEAELAVRAMRETYHGEFANHG